MLRVSRVVCALPTLKHFREVRGDGVAWASGQGQFQKNLNAIFRVQSISTFSETDLGIPHSKRRRHASHLARRVHSVSTLVL